MILPLSQPTTADFVSRIHREVPELVRDNCDDFSKINALRQWAYEHIPLAMDRAAVLDAENQACHQLPLEELFARFNGNQGGFWASGTSRTFCRLCAVLGYSSATIQIGDASSSNNHYLSLVRIKVDEKPAVVIVDSYFNYSIAFKDCSPADIRDVVTSLKKRLTGQLRFLNPVAKEKYRALRSINAGNSPCVRETAPWQWYAGTTLMDWLIDQAGSINPLYLLAFPLSINTYGAHAPELHMAYSALQNIRLGKPTVDAATLRRLRDCRSDQDFEKELPKLSVDTIRDLYGDDSWFQNRLVSIKEFMEGASRLSSYPTDINIPIADICNARCSFCTSWLEGKRLLKLSELDAFEDVIRHASAVGLAGHGEPLSHPKLPDILDRLANWLDPRARCYVITNAVYLEQNLDRLLAARVMAYAISLNAATPSTHEAVMGLERGAFDRVLGAIERLLARRDAGTPISVTISLVLTQQNVAEVADFVRLGNRLGVNGIQLKTLAGAGGTVPGLNYHLLPPYQHPEYAAHKANAIAAIQASKVEIIGDPDSWDTPIFPKEVERAFAESPPTAIERRDALQDQGVRAFYSAQQKYGHQTRGELIEKLDDRDGSNPYGREPRFACKAPYFHLYLNDFSYNVSPCCYMGKVPGHEPVIYDGSYDFFAAWNSPAMVALRERLNNGPLFRMCTRCPAVY